MRLKSHQKGQKYQMNYFESFTCSVWILVDCLKEDVVGKDRSNKETNGMSQKMNMFIEDEFI